MINFLRNRPEVFVLNFVWLVAGVLYAVNAPVFRVEADASGLVLVAVGLIALNLGLTISPGGGPWLNRRRTGKDAHRVVAILSLLGLLGAFIYYLAAGRTGLNLADVRADHFQAVRAGDASLGPARLVSLLLLCLFPFAIDAGLRTRSYQTLLLVTLPCLLGCGLLVAFSVGGRAQINFLFMFTLGAAVACFWPQILARWKKVATATATVLFCFVAANGLFFYFRTGGDDTFRQYMVDFHVTRSLTILNDYGLGWLPTPVLYTYSYFASYLGTPIAHFTFFTTNYDLPPLWGMYQFRAVYSLVGNAFGVESPTTYKLISDDIFIDVGYLGNVWATGFREMVMDFGVPGFAVALFIGGMLIGLARSRGAAFASLRVLYALSFAWLLMSPFSNLLLTREFEFTIYLVLVLLLTEFVNGPEWYLAPAVKQVAAPAGGRPRLAQTAALGRH